MPLIAVKALAVGLILPSDSEPFRARQHIPDRKSIKLMTRAVQLGIAAARKALENNEIWQTVEPIDRGFFVGASPQVGKPEELSGALLESLENGQLSLQKFAEHGIPRIHPLWLVRGLSNNILGFGSAFWDFQGVNMNYCQAEEGGWHALVEGARAVEEGRVQYALSGGADVLLGADELMGRQCAEGGAFILWGPSDKAMELSKEKLAPYVQDLGALGAATWPVALARELLAKG